MRVSLETEEHKGLMGSVEVEVVLIIPDVEGKPIFVVATSAEETSESFKGASSSETHFSSF